MDIINNHGEKIGFSDVAISKENSITINRIHNVTTVNERDRTTGKVTTQIFIGDSPYGG